MHDQEFHAAIDGFGEKSSLCSRTVARRMKKLIKDGVPMRDWNVQQVLDWLDYAGLHQHRSLFQRCPVDGELLSKLSSETLKTKVGIRSYGHRQNIMEELDQLKSFISKAAAQGGSSQDAAQAGNFQGTSAPPSPRPPSASQTPRSIVPADVPTQELLADLKQQRSQWVRDRQNLMAMLGPKLAFLQVPPEQWTTQQVCDWIDHVGLSLYRKLFAHGCITGRLLMSMTLQTLDSEVGIRTLQHRRLLMSKIRSLVEQNGADTFESHQVADGGPPLSPNVHQLGQLQGQMRECDFNIMRLDQRITKVKKSLGIDVPLTLEYVGAQERVEVFRANMITKGSEESWWLRQYREYDKRIERQDKRVRKRLQEEEQKRQKTPLPPPSRENCSPTGPFMVRHL